jgi:hypothetical protein
MMNSNDKKWTVAEVLTNFGQRQSQIQQEKMVKQQLKDALMQNQAQGLSQFVPGMQQEMPPMQQDMSLDQAYQEAKRGGIHLDPRKKGTFKAQATRMGMSIQEAANHILSNKDDYSPAMRRKANFAKNFAKEEGGTTDCPKDFKWDETLQSCVPIVTEDYAKDYLTDWYARRGEVINDPNFDELPKPKGHVDWLGKVLPMINERMATSPLTYAYPDIIDGDPALRGTYTRQTKTQGPVIEISSMARQNPFEHAQTDLHERTTDSTFTAEKYVEPQHQKIINENIKSYEDFRDASPIADQVKADEALDDELYGQYLYSTGQTPEGLGNMHSYVMNWRKTFNMDPTKVYSEEEIADMVKQAENAGMFTKGSPAFNDDMYKLFKLSKDNKSMTDLFNLMVKNTSPVKPNRFNDDIQYARDGGSFGYMPNFF